MPAVFFVCLSKVVFIGIVVFVDEAGTKFLGRTTDDVLIEDGASVTKKTKTGVQEAIGINKSEIVPSSDSISEKNGNQQVESLPEWLLIEMQGTVIPRDGNSLASLPFGDIKITGKTATLLVGQHLLQGKIVQLEKPFVVMHQEKMSANLPSQGTDTPGTSTSEEQIRPLFAKKLSSQVVRSRLYGQSSFDWKRLVIITMRIS
eukprot:gene4528-6742_t